MYLYNRSSIARTACVLTIINLVSFMDKCCVINQIYYFCVTSDQCAPCVLCDDTVFVVSVLRNIQVLRNMQTLLRSLVN